MKNILDIWSKWRIKWCKTANFVTKVPPFDVLCLFIWTHCISSPFFCGWFKGLISNVWHFTVVKDIEKDFAVPVAVTAEEAGREGDPRIIEGVSLNIYIYVCVCVCVRACVYLYNVMRYHCMITGLQAISYLLLYFPAANHLMQLALHIRKEEVRSKAEEKERQIGMLSQIWMTILPPNSPSRNPG